MDASPRADWASVIIPTYNRAEILPDALQSVLEQTYRPIELIIVDDGSTDETTSVVNTWQSAHQTDEFQIEYVSQNNAGPSAARNRGLVHASGEYIQFLDSDDRLHPQKLSVHVQALETAPSCDVIIGDNVLFTPSDGPPDFNAWNADRLVQDADHRTVDALSLLNGNLVNGLYRYHLLQQAGPINETLRWMEDVEYNIRVSTVATSVRTVNAPFLAFSRHDGDHLTGVRNRPEGFETGFAAVKAMEDTVDALPKENDDAIRHKIGNFYMGLAHLALRFDQSNHFERATDAALRNRTGHSFQLKTRLLRIFRRLLGNDLTHRLWSRVAQFDTTQRTG